MRTLALVIGPVPLLTLLGYLAARDWGLMVGLAVGCISSIALIVFLTTLYIFDASVFFGLFFIVCLLPLTMVALRIAGRASDSFMPTAVIAQLLAAAGFAVLMRTVFRWRGGPAA